MLNRPRTATLPLLVFAVGFLSAAGCAPWAAAPAHPPGVPGEVEVLSPREGDEVTALASMVAQQLIDMRAIDSARDLAGVPVTFRVVDQRGHWTNQADLIVDLGESGRMRISASKPEFVIDLGENGRMKVTVHYHTGEVTFTFSEGLIDLDPVLTGQSDGEALDVHFELATPRTARRDGGASNEPAP